MEWFTIILLLVISLALIVIEIVFIPGTTLFGVAGFIFAAIGLFIAFKNLGNTHGLILLGEFTAVAAAVIYYSLRSEAWRRYALNSTISSKVNDENKILLQIGDTGRTISALRPSGKASFNERIVEVHTLGSFLDAGSLVKVIRLESNKIFVAPSD
jgi:membrane-bound ClpP family serine protease